MLGYHKAVMNGLSPVSTHPSMVPLRGQAMPRAADREETSRLPWPAAAAIILGLSLLLWGVILAGIATLIG